ncbi:MAG: glycosyltransferase family 4 protein [Phycisphaerales bacterium]|nr:glycosyltransferase family 4 protein [Phycisphaerales bacterium]
MRALWLVRSNLTRHPGGDTTQILKTAAGLRAIGVQVTLTSELSAFARANDYDVAHLFHLDRLWENIPASRVAANRGKPIALSTIYWPSDEFDRLARTGVQGRLSRILGTNGYQSLRQAQRGILAAIETRNLRSAIAGITRFRAGVRALLRRASVILPNSAVERDCVWREFGVQTPCQVVPNAVDPAIFGGAPSRDGREGVLCVGRIEPRKNQLALIRAMRDSSTPLTFVGASGRFSRDYAAECRRLAGPNTRWIEQVEPAALPPLYRAAKAHACVSWYETPGLASLEAALCGCAIVVTPGGSTREYFQNDAHYSEPDKPETIRAAIEAALAQPAPPALAQRVAREYNWAAAAGATLAAYQMIAAS